MWIFSTPPGPTLLKKCGFGVDLPPQCGKNPHFLFIFFFWRLPKKPSKTIRFKKNSNRMEQENSQWICCRIQGGNVVVEENLFWLDIIGQGKTNFIYRILPNVFPPGWYYSSCKNLSQFNLQVSGIQRILSDSQVQVNMKIGWESFDEYWCKNCNM